MRIPPKLMLNDECLMLNEDIENLTFIIIIQKCRKAGTDRRQEGYESNLPPGTLFVFSPSPRQGKEINF